MLKKRFVYGCALPFMVMVLVCTGCDHGSSGTEFTGITGFSFTPISGLKAGTDSVKVGHIAGRFSVPVGGSAPYIYELVADSVDGHDNDQFEVVGTDLKIKSELTAPGTLKVFLKATDNDGNSVTKAATITVADAQAEDPLYRDMQTITERDFKIGQYEVTYELWYEVYQWAISAARGNEKYRFANAGSEGSDGVTANAPTKMGKYEPVTYISWWDAVVWCNAYSEMTGKEPVYTSNGTIRDSTQSTGTVTAADKNGYCLPRKEQWAKARGSDETDLENAWYAANAEGTTHIVGLKNPTGTEPDELLYDMSGNVSEWCWDPSNSGISRTVCGGSWSDVADNVTANSQRFFSPTFKDINIGFRLCSKGE
ncbi:MAG: formylglycine-generating enzyme family protein [Treponema sp.]|jgi:formylglycine-generating enzyme required for sulfatase activity|nr:formylglycine-generating enzyme family protein [Treponema sp.]